MEFLINLVVEYRFVIISAIIGVLYARFDGQRFRNQLAKAILNAKELAREGAIITGVEQEQWVVDNLEKFVSKRFIAVINFIGEKQTRELIRFVYRSSFDFVDDGKVNKSIKWKVAK